MVDEDGYSLEKIIVLQCHPMAPLRTPGFIPFIGLTDIKQDQCFFNKALMGLAYTDDIYGIFGRSNAQ